MEVGEPVSGEQSIPRLISRLSGDAREFAQAEIGLARAKVAEAVVRYRTAAIFFVVAATLGLCGFIALLVGLILSLATLLGPGLATLVVVGVVMIAAVLLALRGRAALFPGKTV